MNIPGGQIRFPMQMNSLPRYVTVVAPSTLSRCPRPHDDRGNRPLSPLSSGILVNGQIIGDKQTPPDGKIYTYFWRFGIIHRNLGVKMEVSTNGISVFRDGTRLKLRWSNATSVKGDG